MIESDHEKTEPRVLEERRPPRRTADEAERLAAIERLEAFFREGQARGKAQRFSRDDMHER